MPYSDGNSIKIFVSYALEDGKLAEILAKTLRMAFVDTIEITMMSEFSSGLNWRKFIEKSIVQSDVLIAIASGRLKPSHSFTGTEVGIFSLSTSLNPKMARFPHLDRRMVPFAVLARVPTTMNEFEGIDIDPASLRDVRFDPANMEGDLKNSSDVISSSSDMIYKLLSDFEDIIIETKPDRPRKSNIVVGQRNEILKDFARALSKDILEFMLLREKSVTFPKAKLILRTNPGSANKTGPDYDPFARAKIKFEGDCSEIFGFVDPAKADYTWSELTSNTDNDIVFQWQKALSSLIYSTKNSNFIEDNSIISFDRKKLFRIFASRVTVYYNNETEFQIYCVEILSARDYGDPITTLLQHSLEIGLVYRFMFLEKVSEFSSSIFEATKLDSIKERTSRMVDGLNLLLLKARNYELDKPSNIITILGLEQSGTIDDLYRKWEHEKRNLCDAAGRILSAHKTTEEDKADLVAIIKTFCEHTREMNRNYTAAVLSRLNERITANN